MRRLVLLLAVFLGLVGTGFAFLLGLGAQSRADDQQSILAGVISKVLSSPDIKVRIGAVEGALASKSVIKDITLADAQGVFLSIDKAELDWRRAALLSRRLEIDRLAIGTIAFVRKPVTSAKTAEPGEPLLPELPVKLIVKALELQEFTLGQAAFGHAARVSAQGRMMLGPPSEGLDLDLSLKRLDREGGCVLRLAFVPKGEILDLSAQISEVAGGLIAHLAAIPDAPPVSFNLAGSGPLDAWKAQVSAQAGPEISADGSASITRSGPARTLALDLKGRIAALLPPIAAPLLPGEAMITLRGSLPDGSHVLDIAEASLSTSAMRLGWGGRVGPDIAEGRISGVIAELGVVEPRLKGALTLDANLNSKDGSTQGDLRASGVVNGHPLATSARFSHAGLRYALEDIAFSFGQNRIAGQVSAEENRLGGQMRLELGKLEQLAGLLLTPLAGTLSGDVALAHGAGGQDLRLVLNTPAFSGFGASILALKTDLNVQDALRKPRLSGKASADALGFSGQSFGRASLVATAGATGSDIVIETKGGALSLNAAAGVAYGGEETRIELKRLALSGKGASLRLVRPADLNLRGETLHFAQLDLMLGSGSLALSGAAGRDTALKFRAAKLPLAQIRAFAPALGVVGTLDAEADLSGDIAALSGPYSIMIRQFSHPALRQSGLPLLDIRAKGTLASGRAGVAADITGGSRLALRIEGESPLDSAGALDLTIKGTLDAALANAQLAGQGQRLSGQLRVDATLKGTALAPQVGGTAMLDGGSFIDPVQGLRFTNINGRFSGAGDRVRVESLQASTPGGGSIGVSGSLIADPANGIPADLRITGQKARLVENDVMILVADLDLAVSGPLAAAPSLGGVVRIVSLDVMIPERLSTNSAPLANAKHIAPPEQTKTRLDMIEKAKKQRAQRRATSQGGARLAIRLDAPSRIAVRGRGIDAELGGTLNLAGTLHAPRATGAFELRRGQLDMLTQRLAFSRGRITFNGDTIPELDFLSATTAGGVTAKVAVTGRADEPVFTLSSEPQLPPDEVLARLMFERAAGTLSPFQAVQLAHAVARLTGKGGPDFLDRTRKALGVDTLDVDLGKNGPRVGASRYITNNIRLGVKTGANPEDSGISVNVDVSRRIKLQGEATRDGRGSIGIGAEIEY